MVLLAVIFGATQDYRNPLMTGIISAEGISNQDSNDEISFRGNTGPMINCESFSYQVFIYVNRNPSVPVVIEIIDPDGNVAGRDEFESNNYDSTRTIELSWGKDGRYLIQVHYKGQIYQEDFSYDKLPPEIFQEHRMSCLREQYVKPIQEETWSWFNFLTDPNNDDFWKNVRTAEKLLRDSDSNDFIKRYQDLISEKAVNETLRGKTQAGNIDEVTSIFQELRIILPKLVEKKAISIFEDGERNIINNSSITLDEKTELIFELRKLRDDAIIVQKMYAVQYADTLDSIYKNAKEQQESLEYQKQLNELLEQEEKKRTAQIEKEKESIRQEILSQKRPEVPEWIKDNAKQWSEDLIEDNDFTNGIRHLLKENIISIPELPQSTEAVEKSVPEWVKNNAAWWTDGLISEDDFLKGIKYLVKMGIIQV